MKHQVPRKGVLFALAVLVVLTIHVAMLHAVSNVRGWWWPVLAGVALVLAVKTAMIIAHVHKGKRAKATSPESQDQRRFRNSGSTNLADPTRNSHDTN